MQAQDFSRVFEALAGMPSFPWQAALYRKLIDGQVPKTVGLPTGLGKTSVIAIWLCALATKPNDIPRRLVYVVNRRTVVDQTTAEVEKWRRNLAVSELATTLAKLSAIALEPGDLPLAISTLRGQFADNRAWSADPARPAVIVGTVDMIGSRLLFNGYGTGFRTRPHHAALIGQDVLLVHDEAHLEPAFQTLLETITGRQSADHDLRPLRVLELSATNRGGASGFQLTPEDVGDPQAGKQGDPRILRRLLSPKKLTLHNVQDERKNLASKLVELALRYRESKRAILIFARSLSVVQQVVAELTKAKINRPPEVLTGTLRGWERDHLVQRPGFQRFLPNSNRTAPAEAIPAETIYLVATSAGEVGVNLSADDLVCDLSTFESMSQRFGRVNRFGELADTSVDVVHPTTFEYDPDPKKRKASDQVEIARERTLALLKQLKDDASPSALGELDPMARCEAFSPSPTILPATDILFDAWSLTTIRDRLPGRPTVEAYLHGIAEWEPPETHVAWRTEVELIDDEQLLAIYPPEELLNAYPLKPHELLRDVSSRVRQELERIAERTDPGRIPIWISTPDGQVTPTNLHDLLNEIAQLKRGQKSPIDDAIVLLPPSAGGLGEDGSLNGKAPYRGTEDIADNPPAPGAPLVRRRVRTNLPAATPSSIPSRDFRLLRTIDLKRFDETSDNLDEGSDEVSATGRYWHWWQSRQDPEGANLYRAQSSVRLDVHNADVARHASRIAEKLRLAPELQRAIALAARYHDAGKNRRSWQIGIGNPTPNDPLAKAGRHLVPRETGDRYRHEFGSLCDIATAPEFTALPDAERDLVLHLIAAHHGRARPHFPPDEATDPEAALDDVQNVAGEVPLRFARLQRRFGRWGLAYLESILRAADYAASAKPSSALEDIK